MVLGTLLAPLPLHLALEVIPTVEAMTLDQVRVQCRQLVFSSSCTRVGADAECFQLIIVFLSLYLCSGFAMLPGAVPY